MIADWINEAMIATGVKGSRLNDEEVARIIHDITEKYTAPIIRRPLLWERFAWEVDRYCVDGWDRICEFGEPNPILFYEDGEKFEAFSFDSSESLRQILREIPGFEFYVTSPTTDFVLCHNHHNFLVGVGSCLDWLEEIPPDDD